MTSLAKYSFFILALVLAGCGSTSEVEPVQPAPQVALPGIDPVTGLPIDRTPGLNDREPDTCHAADYQSLIGQTEAEVRAAGIPRPTRMVTPTSIIDQERYDSFRINFHTDVAGRIFKITCG